MVLGRIKNKLTMLIKVCEEVTLWSKLTKKLRRHDLFKVSLVFHISENLCWVMILADIEDDQANNFATIGSNHLLSASLINSKLELVPKTLGSSDFFTQSLCQYQTDPLWLKTCKNCFKSKWQQIDSISMMLR